MCTLIERLFISTVSIGSASTISAMGWTRKASRYASHSSGAVKCARKPLDDQPAKTLSSRARILGKQAQTAAEVDDAHGQLEALAEGAERVLAIECHIAEPQPRDGFAQAAVGPITRIHQLHARRNACQQSRADLLQRNLRLGLEPDRTRNMHLGAAGPIADPLSRQIQSIGDRQTGMMVGDRQRHRHLTIGLLAELPAILMMHPHRMPAPASETMYRR
jgi:hypothetical protein